MPLVPEDFLQQADALAGKSGATEADFRRAISTAYYAVYNFSLTAAVDLVLGPSSGQTSAYTFVYRSVDHKVLRGLCAQLSQSKPQNVPIVPSNGFGDIANFARVTENLYGQRLLADYDPSTTFTEVEARIAISNARQAIAWFKSCHSEQQKAFLIMLLFRQR